MSREIGERNPSQACIVVPLDESRRAELALEIATPIASRLGASMILVTVPLLHQIEIEQQMQHIEVPRQPPSVPSPEELLTISRAEAEQYLYDLRKRLAEREIPTELRVVSQAPAEAVVDIAEEVGARMIAMATHGRSGLSRWALGSVADKVLQTARQPVLLTRKTAGWGPEGPRNILVPLDGSGLAEKVLPEACALARAFDAEITLARVVIQYESEHFRMRWAGQSHDVGDLREQFAQDYLEDQAETLRAEGYRVTTEVLSADHVAEALLELDQRDSIHLLAMTTHGLGGLKRWAFGSVADRIIRGAETPVLLVRAHDDPD